MSVPGGNGGGLAYLSIFFAHGLTAAFTIYLAVRGGSWLDGRLGTSPWMLIVLVLLVVAANLHLLVKDVLAEADRQDRRSRPGPGVRGGR